MERPWLLYVFCDILVLLLCTICFLAPLYSVENTPPNQYYAPYTLHCYTLTATVSNTDCPVFHGIFACNHAFNAINHGICGTNGSYILTTTDYDTLAVEFVIYVGGILFAAVFGSLLQWCLFLGSTEFPRYYPYMTAFRRAVVYIHHFVMVPFTVMLMIRMEHATMSSSYAHQLGFNQRPQYGPMLYVVVAVVTLLILTDNIKPSILH